jgi:hypothetical protein
MSSEQVQIRQLLLQAVAILDAQGAPPASAARPAGGRPAATLPADAGGPKMRFGRAKGTLLSQADDGDLNWYGGVLEGSMADPTKARWQESNARDLADVRAEQARRSGVAAETPNVAPPVGDDDIPF